MSSPNEPGYPRTGDGPGSANGSAGATPDAGPPPGGPARNGPTNESAGAPPWQRGQGRPRPAPRPGDGAEGGRAGSAAGHAPGADARLNRFVSGGPATPPSAAPPRDGDAPRGDDPRGDGPRAERPERPERPEAARPEPTRPETYASELPDLSGPTRHGARKPSPERSGSEAPSTRPAGRTQVAGRAVGPVRASMQIRRLDPWSVLKVSLVLSVALFFVWMIAVAFLYLVLGGMGVWSKLNSNVGDLLTSASGSGGELVSSGTIFGGAALIGLLNIVLLTAMATCGAFIYNLTTDLVGGVEVTLADRD